MKPNAQAMNYPPEQKVLLIEHLLRDIRARADDAGIDVEAAFLEIAVRDFGYNLDRGVKSDGSGDFGFDYFEINEREAYLFQCKSVDASSLVEYSGDNVFGPEKIQDAQRMLNVVRNLDNIPENANGQLRKGLEELRVQISKAGRVSDKEPSGAENEDETVAPYAINVVLVMLADKLSEQASEEFESLARNNLIVFSGIKISVRFQVKLLDQLLSERWRKENEHWKDRVGKTREKARLTICEGHVLRPGTSYVFFTQAIDLVKMYEDFGYQIFEPNVRAEIQNSPVNKEIKRSISSRKGREEFRHLNNGITIIASSVQNVGPKDKLQAIDIIRPGIVNGLQTVKSLHDAYRELNQPKDQEHFDRNCTVLCRVHGPSAVKDVNQLITATNNQNAMKPRNLKSNNPEQLIYEQLFAELGWFYQRKEGAWRAYKSNPRGWPKLSGKHPKDFRSGKAERLVDNEEVSQNWLSFIGYSKEAINERKAIFASDNDELYDFCFLRRPVKHGFHHAYKIKDGFEASRNESAAPSTLLFAQLSRELYDGLVPGPKAARNEAIERLGIKNNIPRGELEAKLVDDDAYMTTRIMNGTKTLFVEFMGFIAMEAWGESLHRVAPSIIRKGAFGELSANHRIEPAREVVSAKSFSPDEALISIYELFKHCTYRLVTDPSWKRQYDAANVKSRFLYEDKNRHRLIEELRTVDQLVARRGLGQPWSDSFDEKGGIFLFFKGFGG